MIYLAKSGAGQWACPDLLFWRYSGDIVDKADCGQAHGQGDNDRAGNMR